MQAQTQRVATAMHSAGEGLQRGRERARILWTSGAVIDHKRWVFRSSCPSSSVTQQFPVKAFGHRPDKLRVDESES